MSNNKQSSVEWLVEQIQNNIHHTIRIPSDTIEQAKAMHKEEIMDAIDFGNYKGYEEHKRTCIYNEDKDYYNRLYGGNIEQQ